MLLARIALVALASAFAALIVHATGRAAIGQSFAAMVADPWGLVALVDLYLGFLVTAVVVALFEDRAWKTAAFVAALLVLGNVVSLAWLAWRLPRLRRRLTRDGP